MRQIFAIVCRCQGSSGRLTEVGEKTGCRCDISSTSTQLDREQYKLEKTGCHPRCSPGAPLSSPRSPPGGQSHPQMLPIPQFLGQLSPGNCTTLPLPHLLIITPSPPITRQPGPQGIVGLFQPCHRTPTTARLIHRKPALPTYCSSFNLE